MKERENFTRINKSFSWKRDFFKKQD